MQAQDPRGFRLAVRARTRGVTVRDIEESLDDGRLVVTWLNRGTLHLVRAEDYPLLQALTTPPLFTANARRLAQEGVPASDADKAVRAVVRAVADGPCPRATLRTAVARAGVRVQGQALVHVLFLAALRGHVVRGPMVGAEQAYVSAPDWLPSVAAPPDRDKALGELARRYLRGHGPAAARDLAKWAGLPLRDARAGLASVRTVDAGDGLVALPERTRARALPPPRLLGAYDELLMDGTSRAPVLGPHERDVVNGGLFRPFALVDGQSVATWRFERGKVALAPFSPLPSEVATALDVEARAVERFLGG